MSLLSLAPAAISLVERCQAGLVEPMLIEIRPAEMFVAKFAPLPGHPAPGNAGRGFSRPVRQPGQPVAGPGTPFERVRLDLPVAVAPDDLMAAAADLAEAIGWEDAALWLMVVADVPGVAPGYLCQITPQMRREEPEAGARTGIPTPPEEIATWSITLARGGALVWEDYPDGLERVGTLGEQARVHRLHSRERESVAGYVAKRGGRRPGAGRKGPGGHPVPPGARPRLITLTDPELAAVRELVARMRSAHKESSR